LIPPSTLPSPPVPPPLHQVHFSILWFFCPSYPLRSPPGDPRQPPPLLLNPPRHCNTGVWERIQETRFPNRQPTAGLFRHGISSYFRGLHGVGCSRTDPDNAFKQGHNPPLRSSITYNLQRWFIPHVRDTQPTPDMRGLR